MRDMSNQRKTVRVVIDGREVEAEYRAPLIDVAGRVGVSIPTLCHHESLEPAGACRLCLVEEVRDGWSKFVTACNYPVEDGMVFRTSSEEVLRYRRMTVESLLARCPQVPVVRELASAMGIEESRFVRGDDTCILCGMCTRACETYATSAISMLNRGQEKTVGTFAAQPPDDCVGCGSCVKVCPTGHIEESRGAGTYTVWDREFKVAVCGVDEDRCIGCGACEESCPFSVPRVVLRSDGGAHARIDPVSCRGCGVCYARCPSGAISQPRTDRSLPDVGEGLLVMACGRANLSSSVLPKGVTLMEVQCSGGADVTTLLGALARGFDGVLVMGRHQSTCRLDGAEVHARDVVRRADELAALCGLGAGRIIFAEPPPGPDGPLDTVAQALSTMSPNPLKEALPTKIPTATMTDALQIMRWLGERKELDIDPSGWLALHDLPSADKGGPTVDAGAIPYLDILMSGLLTPADLGDSLGDALSSMNAASPGAGISVGALTEMESPIPSRERIVEIHGQLAQAASRGEETLAVDGPARLAAYLLACRTGSWRRTHVRPVLSHKTDKVSP